ncbi:MAG: sel1 repeat family protein, partial [Acidobacteria bacterium]|nr:sel1 repeat family protein [Acidobacteriota bacterium]
MNACTPTRIAITLLLLVPALALAAPPTNEKDPLEQGLAAYKAGHYQEALDLWRPLAAQGNPEAQFRLGYMYANGLGVALDQGLALTWYRKAAELGHAKAQYNVGIAYLQGTGVGKDPKEASTWLKRSASQGWAP